jgi:hypothetical protein
VVRILCVLLQFSDANVYKHALPENFVVAASPQGGQPVQPHMDAPCYRFFTGTSSGISIWMETNRTPLFS